MLGHETCKNSFPFELCSHFKSLPPVSVRELSANLTWRASNPFSEFPALGPETQSRCVQGERGVKQRVKTVTELARHSSENTHTLSLLGQPRLAKASSGWTILEPVKVARNLELAQTSSRACCRYAMEAPKGAPHI
jgi:hypothetical protein